ncbi:MAG: primosomal protein N' [Nitrospirales bacterium]|nr:MAG: primosomal protein N' [Nitrospirales bacterium]
MFADIVFPQRRYRVFTYRIPARLTRQIQIGSRVLVPLGRSSTQGLVFKLSETFSAPSGRVRFSQRDLREIIAIVDTPTDSSLSPTLLKLANHIETYYLAPPGAGLRLILPPIASNRVSKRVVLTDEGKRAIEHSRLSPDQSTVLSRLTKTSKGLTAATLLKSINGNGSVLSGLKRRKLIQEIEWVRDVPEKTIESPVDRSAPSSSSTDLRKGLSEVFMPVDATHDNGEVSWLMRVRSALLSRRYDEILLNASRAIRERLLSNVMREVLHYQRTVLVLCPEVQQVSRVVERLRAIWGERVAEYHGDLSVQRRSQVWQDIQGRRYDVVVGTRLATFVPLASVGVIWVDQEEDASFQDEQSPYYHARDVARMRATLEPAMLVLGSSHPSLETFHQLGQVEETKRLQEYHVRKPVNIEVVNLREVQYGDILSQRMMKGMKRALEGSGQVILFLNRKGFSRSLTCKDCGYVPQCARCGVVLILYQKPVHLRCSYCGAVHVPPMVCPECQSVRLEASGYGTEQLETVVQEKFPQARVARFDRETVKTVLQENTILKDFHNKNIDVLIGTELLFHVDSFQSVQFVGIPHADGGLHFPDFRTAERAYHRLVEAVQLVNEETPTSEVILQTLLPTHHVLRSVAERDPSVFYQEELQIRHALHYPPYSRLLHIAIAGKKPDRVHQMAMYCRERLVALRQPKTEKASCAKSTTVVDESILGPLLSPRAKDPGLTRYILIVKELDCEREHSRVRRMQEELAEALTHERLSMEIKVDPADMN